MNKHRIRTLWDEIKKVTVKTRYHEQLFCKTVFAIVFKFLQTSKPNKLLDIYPIYALTHLNIAKLGTTLAFLDIFQLVSSIPINIY